MNDDPMLAGMGHLEAGRLAEARAAFMAARDRAPAAPGPILGLGVVALREGNPDEAVALLKPIATDSAEAAIWMNLGLALDEANRHDEAEQAFGRAIAGRAAFPEALAARGSLRLRRGRFEAARADLEAAAALSPNHPVVLNNLGSALRALGEDALARDRYLQAVAADPELEEAHLNLQEMAFRTGGMEAVRDLYDDLLVTHAGSRRTQLMAAAVSRRIGDTETALQRGLEACAMYPDDVDAHIVAALSFLDLERYAEGIALLTTFGERLEEVPARVFSLLGYIMRVVGRSEEAGECYQAAVEIDPTSVPDIVALADHELRCGDAQGALARVEAAIDRMPNEPTLHAERAHLLRRLGRKEDAIAVLEPWMAMSEPPAGIVREYAGLVETAEARERAVAAMEAAAADMTWDLSRVPLLFSMGELLDKLGRPDDAFEKLEEANRLRFAQFDPEASQAGMDKLYETFASARFQALPPLPPMDNPPIFIVGMPRSGTTLLERIVSAVPTVFAAGEIDLVRKSYKQIVEERGLTGGLGELDYYDAELFAAVRERAMERLEAVGHDPQAVRGTDKMPHGFLAVPLIKKIFPNSPILHCRRDPIDNGLSLYFYNFVGHHDYAYDLANIGTYYRMYDDLMARYRDLGIEMLDVQYEDVVADQEGMSRKVLEYCGLPWHDDVMQFHKAKDTVHTASWDQVTRPIYTTSVKRWRRYEKHLGPLIDALGDLADTSS